MGKPGILRLAELDFHWQDALHIGTVCLRGRFRRPLGFWGISEMALILIVGAAILQGCGLTLALSLAGRKLSAPEGPRPFTEPDLSRSY